MFLYCLIAYGKLSRNKRHVHTVVYSIFLSLLQIRNRHGIISTMLIDTSHKIVTEIQSLRILRCLSLPHQVPYNLLSRDISFQVNKILNLGIRAVIQFLLIFRSWRCYLQILVNSLKELLFLRRISHIHIILQFQSPELAPVRIEPVSLPVDRVSHRNIGCIVCMLVKQFHACFIDIVLEVLQFHTIHIRQRGFIPSPATCEQHTSKDSNSKD